MEYLIFGLLILITGALIALIVGVYRQKQTDPGANLLLEEVQKLKIELQSSHSEQRKEVQERLERVQDQLTKGMQFSHISIQEQFKQSSEADAKMRTTIQEITTALSEVKSTNKQVLDFSGQLQHLQNILNNPKQRGVLGEYWLETLLSNVMPTKDLYAMQYTLGEDEQTGQKLIADAVIFVDKQIIPIDAKFSLENYNRLMKETDPAAREVHEKTFKSDVKKRIDETSKYIRPEFQTTTFAFMFIPAEGVYYNLLNAEVGSGINSANLIEYAFERNVMLVSPTSFYAYLQTVLMGLRKLEIEKSTQDIIKRVGELGKHMRAFSEVHDRIGKNLTTVVNQYNSSNQELAKVSKDVVKITNGNKEDIIELEPVIKPLIND
jgi:DNA recombination protein RmuC